MNMHDVTGLGAPGSVHREGLQQDGLTSQREESRSELSHFSLHPSDDGVPTPMIKQKKRRKKERKKESEAPLFL